MPSAWYERYFTADYWTYADAEYTAERTDAEVDYLVEVLTRCAAGARVLDLGCGVGRHAIRLAGRGFEVIGLDVSEYALQRARAAAGAAGVPLELHRVDLLRGDWGVTGADAVICVQAFGWGTDADQLRLLRTARRLLAPDGVLVLDHSSALAITRNYRAEARARIGGAEFDFVRRYDPSTGRSGGEVRVRRADGSTAVLPDDVRLYHPAEVRALLGRAGFTVSAMDADFQHGAPVTLDTRYVQFVAIPAPVPQSALAGHRGTAPPGVLDLRSAPDEAELVAEPIAAAWAEIAATGLPVADRSRRYDLADPYGAARCAPVLAAHLRWPASTGGDGGSPLVDAGRRSLATDRVTAGAGATGLLHGLGRLADGGLVLVDPAGHPGLAESAAAAGSEVRVVPLTEPAAAVAAVARYRPAVTVLDRPGLIGPLWTKEAVAELAAAGPGVLVVDETCGGYLPPGESCALLTDRTTGLVVVRSMSKGYCCGGLRVGFAICSPDLAGRVREVLAPLAVSALAMDVSLALLRQPDPLAALRDRIAAVKPEVAAALSGAGLTPLDTDARVPWLVLPGTARDTLSALCLLAKEIPRNTDGQRSDAVSAHGVATGGRSDAVSAHGVATGGRSDAVSAHGVATGGRSDVLVRVSVPLSAGRLAAFRAAARSAAKARR